MSDTADYPLVYLPELGEAAYNRLPGQDKSRAVIVAMMRAFGETCQIVEDAVFDFATGMPFTVATGAALDRWGAIVAQPRLNLVDADYRRIIGAKILINHCNGGMDAIPQIVAVIIGAGGRAWTVTQGPATYNVNFLTPYELPGPLRRFVKRSMVAVKIAAYDLLVTEGRTGALVLWGPGLPSGYESRLDHGTLGATL
jgi:hypothetical protein